MAWPNTSINTTNLDSTSDSPASARPDLYDAVVAVNDIIASRAAVSGIPSLDSTGRIPTTQINPNITSTSNTAITLNSATQRVNIQNIVNLTPQTVVQLQALTATSGDVSYCSNGDSGNVCLAVYTGSNWRRVSIGANISAS
jgi:hypothetical protein